MSEKNSKYRVAEIIDDFKIVINKGRQEDVKVGDRFLVYKISENEISDPETGENLGALEIVKGTGVVTHVQEKISTLESDRKSDSFRKTIRKPILTFSQFAGEEEIIDRKQTIPFENPEVGDLLKQI